MAAAAHRRRGRAAGAGGAVARSAGALDARRPAAQRASPVARGDHLGARRAAGARAGDGRGTLRPHLLTDHPLRAAAARARRGFRHLCAPADLQPAAGRRRRQRRRHAPAAHAQVGQAAGGLHRRGACLPRRRRRLPRDGDQAFGGRRRGAAQRLGADRLLDPHPRGPDAAELGDARGRWLRPAAGVRTVRTPGAAAPQRVGAGRVLRLVAALGAGVHQRQLAARHLRQLRRQAPGAWV